MTASSLLSRTLRRLVAPLAVTLGLAVALAAPASAHDRLTGSTPADGETLTSAPASLVLTYSAEIQPIGADVTVVGPDGTETRTGDLVIAGTQVDVPLRADAPSGAYQVTWRVTSSDGHPIDGVFTYTLDVPAPVEPSRASTSESPSAAEPTSSAPTEEATTPTPTASETAGSTEGVESAEADAADGSGGSAVVWIVATLVVVAGGATALVLRRRRRSA